MTERGLVPPSPAAYAVVVTDLRGVRAIDPEAAEYEVVRRHVKPGTRAQCVDLTTAERRVADLKAEIEADIADAEAERGAYAREVKFDWARGGIDMGEGVFIPTMTIEVVPMADLDTDE